MTTTAVPKIQPEVWRPKTPNFRSLAALLGLFAVIYIGSLFSPALLDDADATHAEAAREMLVRHDFVTLHVNGVRYLEKAPLMYWLVAASYWLFGVNEFATRLPTALAILAFILLAHRWGRRAFGDRAGIYAALFVCTTAGYYLFSRILIPEALLSLFLAASFWFFLSALDWHARPWRWYAAYACVGLAVLTKGLVAIVFAGATAAGYLLITGQWRRWREFRILSGTALFLLVAAPWHLLAGFRNHGFFWFYFVNEHFLRFLGERYPKDYNKLPASLYWVLHLAWLFPWSLYLPLAIGRVSRSERTDMGPAGHDLGFGVRTRLLCWLWAGIVLVFFSLSTNQEYYTFPAYLPLILLLAGGVAAAEEKARSRWLTLCTALVALIAVGSGGLLVAGLWTSRHLPFAPDIGSVLAAHDLSNDTLSMSHMLDLSGQSFAALRLPAILAAIALLIGPVTALVFRLKRKHWKATWAIALTMALFLTAAHIALVRFEPYLSSRSLARQIEARIQPGNRVMIYGDQAYGSSLLFYLRRPIDLVEGRTTSMWFGSTFPDAPKIFLTQSDLEEAWASPGRVFLFVSPYKRQKVDSILSEPKYVVAESSGKLIYSNRP